MANDQAKEDLTAYPDFLCDFELYLSREDGRPRMWLRVEEYMIELTVAQARRLAADVSALAAKLEVREIVREELEKGRRSERYK
jgi:hypothetical protein